MADRLTILTVGIDPLTSAQIRRALAPEVGAGLEVISCDPSSSIGATPLGSKSSTLILATVEQLAHLPGWIHSHRLLLSGLPQAADLIPPGVCDDFLATPWNDAELRFRVRRLLARRELAGPDGEVVWGPFWLEARGGDVAEVRVELTPSEYHTLDLLARRAGGVVPREAIAALYPGSSDATGRSIDMHISRLRRRLSRATAGWSSPLTIRSRRGTGYYLQFG